MDPHSFNITDKEREDVYAKVFKRFVEGKPSLRLPRLVLVGAQPGAGKSRLAEIARKKLKSLGVPVEADIDDVRPDYPDVDKIFEVQPFKMSAVINKECWGWTSHLLLDARRAKNNVIYQATIRQANRIEDLIKEFQKEGFSVDLYLVATNAKQSVHGIFKRFEDNIEDMESGINVVPRWVPIPFHNAVYRAFPQNADYLAENAKIERVGIFSREGRELYFSEDKLIHRGAGDSIRKEQRRKWTQDERLLFLEQWKVLTGRINARPEGILKPKWYVRTAELYAVEAEYYAQARELCAHPAPSGAVIFCRTPNHHFVKDEESGLFISYERARGCKTPAHPASVQTVA